MGKAVKLLRNYCRKAEKLSKMENEIGSYLVEAGLEDKHAQYSENLIKIGEAVKSLSMIHHAKVYLLILVTILECEYCGKVCQTNNGIS